MKKFTFPSIPLVTLLLLTTTPTTALALPVLPSLDLLKRTPTGITARINSASAPLPHGWYVRDASASGNVKVREADPAPVPVKGKAEEEGKGGDGTEDLPHGWYGHDTTTIKAREARPQPKAAAFLVPSHGPFKAPFHGPLKGPTSASDSKDDFKDEDLPHGWYGHDATSKIKRGEKNAVVVDDDDDGFAKRRPVGERDAAPRPTTPAAADKDEDEDKSLLHGWYGKSAIHPSAGAAITKPEYQSKFKAKSKSKSKNKKPRDIDPDILQDGTLLRRRLTKRNPTPAPKPPPTIDELKNLSVASRRAGSSLSSSPSSSPTTNAKSRRKSKDKRAVERGQEVEEARTKRWRKRNENENLKKRADIPHGWYGFPSAPGVRSQEHDREIVDA